MKTTVEIPDELFRQAKAKAAMEGISLRELMAHGLQLALQQPPQTAVSHRASFPLIKRKDETAIIDSEIVAKALEGLDEEEVKKYAGFMRR